MMTLIETITVGSGGAASIEFTGIPAVDNGDVLVLLSGRGSSSATTRQVQFTINGSTSDLTGVGLKGSGTSVSSSTSIATAIPAATSTANTFGNNSIYFSKFSGSTHKSISIDEALENNSSAALCGIYAQVWASTDAITSLEFSLYGVNFLEHSTASLYTIS
jgi:hypothetical protein